MVTLELRHEREKDEFQQEGKDLGRLGEAAVGVTRTLRPGPVPAGSRN